MRLGVVVLVLVACLVAVPPSTKARSGTVRGTVSLPFGRVAQDARVSFGLDGKEVTSTLTNDFGQYSVSLRSATYTVRAVTSDGMVLRDREIPITSTRVKKLNFPLTWVDEIRANEFTTIFPILTFILGLAVAWLGRGREGWHRIWIERRYRQDTLEMIRRIWLFPYKSELSPRLSQKEYQWAISLAERAAQQNTLLDKQLQLARAPHKKFLWHERAEKTREWRNWVRDNQAGIVTNAIIAHNSGNLDGNVDHVKVLVSVIKTYPYRVRLGQWIRWRWYALVNHFRRVG